MTDNNPFQPKRDEPKQMKKKPPRKPRVRRSSWVQGDKFAENIQGGGAVGYDPSTKKTQEF